MTKLPTHIITGFLGSGKTTFILELLKNKRESESWAIVVNEFGSIAIDASSLQTNNERETVFDIPGGCICCSARGNLQQSLEQILLDSSYNRIIIEPSGLGGVDLIEELVAENGQLQLMPSVCLVDLLAIGNHRLMINPLYRSQIQYADQIIFSKADLLEQEEQELKISTFLKSFPDKPYWIKSKTLFSEQKPLQLFSKTDYPLNPLMRLLPVKGQSTGITYQEKSFTFTVDQLLDPDELFQVFQNEPSVIRAKGFINTSEGWRLINFTPSGSDVLPCPIKDQNELVILIERIGEEMLNSIMRRIEKELKLTAAPICFNPKIE